MCKEFCDNLRYSSCCDLGRGVQTRVWTSDSLAYRALPRNAVTRQSFRPDSRPFAAWPQAVAVQTPVVVPVAPPALDPLENLVVSSDPQPLGQEIETITLSPVGLVALDQEVTEHKRTDESTDESTEESTDGESSERSLVDLDLVDLETERVVDHGPNEQSVNADTGVDDEANINTQLDESKSTLSFFGLFAPRAVSEAESNDLEGNVRIFD